MDIWKKPGQYVLEIPSSWGINELNDMTELVPENGDAAIHISVFRKQTRSNPKPSEAVNLVENFAFKNNLHLVGELSTKCNGYECICTGRFSGGNDGPDQPSIWLVKGIVGGQEAVLGTFCLDDEVSKSYTEGLSILDSLELDEAYKNT